MDVHRYQWSVINFTSMWNGGSSSLKYVCMVLNREIRVPQKLVCEIWQNAQLRCLVDGGANRWRKFVTEHCPSEKIRLPDLITGDFDSITDETLEFFKTIKCVNTPDQNDTDFTKAVGVLKSYLEENQIENIIVFQDTSGRFDQIMANINTLYKVQSSSLNVFLLSSNSITWLLRPGKHAIRVAPDLVERQSWCALIPMGEASKNVTTRGLLWNLCNEELRFGGLVSTSNTYASENIEIDTDNCLIWSMGLFCFDDTC